MRKTLGARRGNRDVEASDLRDIKDVNEIIINGNPWAVLVANIILQAVDDYQGLKAKGIFDKSKLNGTDINRSKVLGYTNLNEVFGLLRFFSEGEYKILVRSACLDDRLLNLDKILGLERQAS